MQGLRERKRGAVTEEHVYKQGLHNPAVCLFVLLFYGTLIVELFESTPCTSLVLSSNVFMLDISLSCSLRFRASKEHLDSLISETQKENKNI